MLKGLLPFAGAQDFSSTSRTSDFDDRYPRSSLIIFLGFP